MNAILDALFTPHYREIKDEFDSFFYTKTNSVCHPYQVSV